MRHLIIAALSGLALVACDTVTDTTEPVEGTAESPLEAYIPWDTAAAGVQTTDNSRAFKAIPHFRQRLPAGNVRSAGGIPFGQGCRAQQRHVC